MAPLTWREVTAPNFSGVSESQKLAGTLLVQGLSNLSGAVGDFNKSRKDSATSDYLQKVSQYTTPEALSGALQSGALATEGVDSEAVKYSMQQVGTTLANQRTGIDNQKEQFNNNRLQEISTTQPQAAKLIADAHVLASSGKPEDVEKSRQMLAGATDLLTKAGWNADNITGVIDGARTAGNAGETYNRGLLENKKFWENEGVSQSAQDIARAQINSNMYTPALAIKAIQEDKDITDPRIKAQAIAMIGKAGEAGIFPQADGTQAFIAGLGLDPSNGQPAAQSAPASADPAAAAAQTSVPAKSDGRSLLGLIDKTEGSASYDTLYGNAQKGSGPFAGVRPSTMTLAQLDEMDKSYGPYVKDQLAKSGQDPRIATPVGRFQIVGDTRRRAAKALGLSSDTVFNADTQNKMFVYLAQQRLSGPQSMESKMANLRQEWEGLRDKKNVPDEVLKEAIVRFENGDVGALTGAAVGGGSGSEPAPLPANSTPAEVNQFSISQMLSDAYSGRSAPAVNPATGAVPAATTTAPVDPAAAGDPAAPVNAALDKAAGEVPAPVKNRFRWNFDEPLDAPAAAPGSTAAAAAPVVPADTAKPVTKPAVSAATEVQTSLDQINLDRIFNGNKALVNEVVNPTNPNETDVQVADRLVSEKGAIPGGNKDAVLQAMQEARKMANGNLSSNIAGALVANNMESRDLTRLFWWDGDRFSNDKERASASLRTNMEGVNKDLKGLGLNKDGSFNMSQGQAQIANDRTSEAAKAKLVQIQAQIATVQQNIANLEVAKAANSTPQIEDALKQAYKSLELLQAAAQTLNGADGPTTLYTRNGPGLPN